MGHPKLSISDDGGMPRDKQRYFGAVPQIFDHLAILLVTFSGWWSDPVQGLSDLQLGDENVTLNHLACILFKAYTIPNCCCTPDPKPEENLPERSIM